MEDGVAHDGVHVRGCEMRFREDQDVQFVVLHVFDESVHLSTFSEPCGVPASNVQLMFGWDLDVMVRSVGGAWVKYMCLEPVCSGVGFGVSVVGLEPISPGLGCGRVGVALDGMRVVLESAVVGGGSVLDDLSSGLEVGGKKIVLASVCEGFVWGVLGGGKGSGAGFGWWCGCGVVWPRFGVEHFVAFLGFVGGGGWMVCCGWVVG